MTLSPHQSPCYELKPPLFCSGTRALYTEHPSWQGYSFCHQASPQLTIPSIERPSLPHHCLTNMFAYSTELGLIHNHHLPLANLFVIFLPSLEDKFHEDKDFACLICHTTRGTHYMLFIISDMSSQSSLSLGIKYFLIFLLFFAICLFLREKFSLTGP